MNTTEHFVHTFPAVRGVQAGRPCYIAMCPLRLVPKLFVFDENEVPVELRAQRSLNRQRVPDIAEYLAENFNSYTLSSITASIDSKVSFHSDSESSSRNIGTLSIPMDAQILINDGQHRRAAIELALKQRPELASDSISVLFFIDEGLERSQQMFADLNKHAVRPNDAISTLYDHREIASQVAKHLVQSVPMFSELTDLERTSISNRSTKLFTISSVKNAAKAFLRKGKRETISAEELLQVTQYWDHLTSCFSDWTKVKNKQLSAWELREAFVHAHGVILQALGHIGPDLIAAYPQEWSKKLEALNEIDWRRIAPEWKTRVVISGRISKSRSSVLLAGNLIKKHLDVPLSETEKAEEAKL